MTFTVQDEGYKTKYHVKEFKKVCGTCKSMKQDITPKRPLVQYQTQEPPISDLKKLREKFNTSEASNKQPPSRYATSRAQDLRDHNYDELIRLIEQLEKENADLKL